jgi:hypothetical protein
MYRVRQDGSLKTQGEIRSMYPNTSFPKTWTPELVDELGLDPVFEVAQPEIARYQIAYKNGVEQVDGKWMWKWSLSQMDDEAKAAKDEDQAQFVRDDRNKRLSDTDWTQVADAPVDKQAWAEYRQALRNVPDQAGFPWDVQWPEMP